jgi:hypothetical protein
MQIDTLLPFRTICRSTHYDHFLPYADRHIMTISYHMQIDTLLQFRTICRSTHYDRFVPYADKYIMTISYHMQNLMLCTFILILNHIQINVIPKYMLHVGIVKSMYLKRKKTNKQTNKKNIYMYIHIINFIKCAVISTLFIILFNKDNYFVTTCRTFEVIKLFLHLFYYLLNS